MTFSLNVSGFSRSGGRPCTLSKFRTMMDKSSSGCCMAPRFEDNAPQVQRVRTSRLGMQDLLAEAPSHVQTACGTVLLSQTQTLPDRHVIGCAACREFPPPPYHRGERGIKRPSRL